MGVSGALQKSMDIPAESNGVMNPTPDKIHSLCIGVEICVVCGDRASGRHYGAISCEGCKGFFKRSIRKRLGYQCRGSQQCEVTKHHRNRCQYCRLQKCLSMGMRSDSVQHERKPISVKKEYSNYTGSSQFNPSSYSNNSVKLFMKRDPSIDPYPVSLSSTGIAVSNFTMHSPLPYYYDGDHSRQESQNTNELCDAEESSDSDIAETVCSPQDNKVIINSALDTVSKLVGENMNGNYGNSDEEEQESLHFEGRLLEDNTVPFHIQSPSPMPAYPDVHYIYESASRLLFLSVHWVRNFTAFQLFNKDMQISLVRGCWTELFTLGLAQCSQAISLPTIIASIISHLHNSVAHQKISAGRVRIVTEHICALRDYVNAMTALNVDDHEYAYLKLISLFSPDHPSIPMKRRMAQLQEKAFQELREQVGECNPDRFARLLLRLPPLRSLRRHIIEQIFFPCLGDQCGIDNIIPFILKMDNFEFSSDQDVSSIKMQ